MTHVAQPAGEAVPTVAAERLTTTLRVLPQLLLALAVVWLYAIEGPALFRVFVLAVAGFAINVWLPVAARLPFFVVLSVAGTFAVFSAGDAAWLIAIALTLIGLANLPVARTVRVTALVLVGAALAVARAGAIGTPWSAAVWPILGAMFMFRLVLYVMAEPTDPRPRRFWWSLAYFFLLPNLAFPLFPVVDYQTFKRTYYDKAERMIYEQGLTWIGRGLLHLVLYRFVYHQVLTDAESVVTLGDLVQFMLGTFLLYLRVSGQFHLIVGLLHLFGFRLPETHKLYYLAHSFTELWRRINIYWTDFMMKTVFYPAYFRLKHLGPSRALGWSTVAVFLTTWLLHSYQWFWLRGGFPLTLQDTLFWGILGAFVVSGGLRELKTTTKARRAPGVWNFSQGLQAAKTFGIFCLLWSLWSTESVPQWLWMLGAATTVDLKGIVLLSLTVATVLFAGGIDWRGPSAASLRLSVPDAARTLATLAALLVLAQPAVLRALPAGLATAARATMTTGLNTRDLALQHRGYYEQLDVRAQIAAAADGAARPGADWQQLTDIGVLRDRPDAMLRDLLPSRQAQWNGRSFSTNQWGMRDREYSREKPPHTLRIALLGPSHVMGNGVADGQTFEAVVEERLNRDPGAVACQQVEILNFGVDGFALPQQLEMLDERVFDFSPDVVVATHYLDNTPGTERFLLKLADLSIIPDDPLLRGPMLEQGLDELGPRGLPIPFRPLRALARRVGIPARMPFGEATSRIRRIADRIVVDSFQAFADRVRARGARPAVLALNVVIDDAPDDVPSRDAIQQADLTLFNLFGVFPVERREALRVAPWDDHPNAEGHRMVADAWYPELVAFLNAGELSCAGNTDEPVMTTEGASDGKRP